VKFPKNKNGFTLFELVIIIVITGILAGVAITKYVSLTRNATDGVARGVLGALRSQNTLIYSQCGPLLLLAGSLPAPGHSPHGSTT
jgi:Tfp pilus assembly protein PilE